MTASAGPKVTEPAQSQGRPLSVSIVHPVSVSADDWYPSSLYVEKDVRVTARRSGIIEKILADRGQSVRAGQGLAVLETDLANRDLEMSEQELRLSKAELDRLKSLHDAKIVSPQDFQRAEIATGLASSKVAYAQAWLERCTVRAPFDGIVVERWAVLGQRVQDDEGTPLFRIAAREPLRARIDLPEDRAAGLANGARAIVQGIEGTSPLPARVVFVGPASDPASGTVPVIVQTTWGRAPLALGSSVRVRIDRPPSRQEASTVRVPREVLLDISAQDGDKTTVLVAEGGRATGRQVHVVRVEGRMATVSGQLDPSDEVIVDGAGRLMEGDRVSIREEP